MGAGEGGGVGSGGVGAQRKGYMSHEFGLYWEEKLETSYLGPNY